MYYQLKHSCLQCELQCHSIWTSLRLEVRNTKLDHHVGDFHGILQFQLTLTQRHQLKSVCRKPDRECGVEPWSDLEYLKKSCGGISFPTVGVC